MTRLPTPEPALQFDDNPSRYARQLARLHAAFVGGMPTPVRPRAVVEDSWRRMRASGRVPEAPDPLIDESALAAEVDGLATAYGSRGSTILRQVGQLLSPCLVDSDLVGVLATTGLHVGARYGEPRALRLADRIGFVDGAGWGELLVGTNAIDLAARLRQPVQVHGPEHWCRNQHDWSCAAAPVCDPASGELIAVIDISGAVRLGHPALLVLVQSLAAQLQLRLREAHRARLERLRTVSWPVVAGLHGPWVLTDPLGWVIGAADVSPGDHIDLPRPCGSGPALLPGLGAVRVSRVGDTVLIVPATHEDLDIGYRLDPATHVLTTTLGGASATHQLSARHAAILLALDEAPSGLGVSDLASRVWLSAVSEVTARAEVSRLRKRFPGLISPAPYRLLAELTTVSGDGAPATPRDRS